MRHLTGHMCLSALARLPRPFQRTLIVIPGDGAASGSFSCSANRRGAMEKSSDLMGENIEEVPVVVLSQTSPARPSSIPNVRDFVRRCLAQSPLYEEDNRAVGETVSH